jgi:hypothetical protein
MLEATESDGRSKWKPCKKRIKEIKEANDQVKSNRKMFEKRLTDVGEASEREGEETKRNARSN